VVQHQLRGGLAAHAELAVDLGGLEAVRVGRHEERGDALRTWPAGPGEDQRHVCPRPVGDEHLAAGEQPVVTVALGLGGERPGVRSGLGFGEPEAAELRARAQARQPLLLLLVRAVLEDRLADQAERHRDDPAHGRVTARDLLQDQAVRQVVAAGPAVLLVDAQPEEPHLAQSGHERAVDGLVPVPLPGERDDPLLREAVGQFFELLVFVGQAQIHATTS
jgi:hypothetical protein